MDKNAPVPGMFICTASSSSSKRNTQKQSNLINIIGNSQQTAVYHHVNFVGVVSCQRRGCSAFQINPSTHGIRALKCLSCKCNKSNAAVRCFYPVLQMSADAGGGMQCRPWRITPSAPHATTTSSATGYRQILNHALDYILGPLCAAGSSILCSSEFFWE